MNEFSYYEPRPSVLALSGELTIACAHELKALLVRFVADSKDPEIDLLNVTMIDSAGLQLLLLARREAASAGKLLKWLGFSLPVEELLDLLNLAEQLGRPAAVVWS